VAWRHRSWLAALSEPLHASGRGPSWPPGRFPPQGAQDRHSCSRRSRDAVQITVKNWKAAGINAELKLKEYGAFISFLGLRGGWADPESYFYRVYMPGQSLNVMGVNDPKLTDMIKLQRRTFDVTQRRQIVYDIQRYLAEQGYFGANGSTRVVSAWDAPRPELHAEQRPRLRRPPHGRLARQVGKPSEAAGAAPTAEAAPPGRPPGRSCAPTSSAGCWSRFPRS
jgi:hypothetical protein